MKRNYMVHMYAVVRVPVLVSASSPVKAALKAEVMTDLYRLLKHNGVEYAEQVVGFQVDEVDRGEVIRCYDFSPDEVYVSTDSLSIEDLEE